MDAVAQISHSIFGLSEVEKFSKTDSPFASKGELTNWLNLLNIDGYLAEIASSFLFLLEISGRSFGYKGQYFLYCFGSGGGGGGPADMFGSCNGGAGGNGVIIFKFTSAPPSPTPTTTATPTMTPLPTWTATPPMTPLPTWAPTLSPSP